MGSACGGAGFRCSLASTSGRLLRHVQAPDETRYLPPPTLHHGVCVATDTLRRRALWPAAASSQCRCPLDAASPMHIVPPHPAVRCTELPPLPPLALCISSESIALPDRASQQRASRQDSQCACTSSSPSGTQFAPPMRCAFGGPPGVCGWCFWPGYDIVERLRVGTSAGGIGRSDASDQVERGLPRRLMKMARSLCRERGGSKMPEDGGGGLRFRTCCWLPGFTA